MIYMTIVVQDPTQDEAAAGGVQKLLSSHIPIVASDEAEAAKTALLQAASAGQLKEISPAQISVGIIPFEKRL